MLRQHLQPADEPEKRMVAYSRALELYCTSVANVVGEGTIREPGPLLASGRDSEIFDYGPGLVLRRSRNRRERLAWHPT